MAFFNSRFRQNMLKVFTLSFSLFFMAFPVFAFIERVSVDDAGGESDATSYSPSISADGRYVAFSSDATNLVAGDTNGVTDIFVYDRQTDTIERVSVDDLGNEGNGISKFPNISADGRYVAFISGADNLVVGDTTSFFNDVFVYDRQTDTIERVNIDDLGNEASGGTTGYRPSISVDGRFVAFDSSASNLVPGDTNGDIDIFVYDRQTDTIERVSVDDLGSEGDASSAYDVGISTDGRYVAFSSDATNLVAGDTNGVTDVFVYDRQTDTIERVSVDDLGSEGDASSLFPSISSDGRYIAFHSYSTNLVAGDTNGVADIFVYDRQTDTIERVSVDDLGNEGNAASLNASISQNSSYVSFISSASNLVSGDTNGGVDVFVYDFQIDTIERVGTGVPFFTPSNFTSSSGRYIAFISASTDLVSADTNGIVDIFIYDSFDSALSANQIYENEVIGTTIGTLSATNAHDLSATFTFSLACSIAGPDDASFSISGSSLQSAEVFDYETKTQYEICVRADDGAGGTFDKTFSIDILDAVPTGLTLSNDSIQEENSIGDSIGTFTGEISEVGATLGYSFCGGVDDASFTIEFFTGELKAAEVFNFATKSTYDICVYVEDQDSGESFQDNFTINITKKSSGGGGGGGSGSNPVLGCTDSTATNYNSNATRNDNSCVYGTLGCTTSFATNYSSSATVDDGSCLYSGCTDTTASNYDSDATISTNTCTYPSDPPPNPNPILGCTDRTATNYNSNANKSDGSCEYVAPPPGEPTDPVLGCRDSSALNFNSLANTDDGSCEYDVTPPPPVGPPDNPPDGGGGGGGGRGFIPEISEKTFKAVAIGGILLSSILTALLQPGLIAGAVSVPIRIWNLIPMLMGFKRKKRPWGTVYDSVTKQPLDPVYVMLKDQNGKDVTTSITDMDGRYGFLVEGGSYTIFANKANYTFPSLKLAGKEKDDLYDNLYFGGNIDVKEKEDVVYKNIPMDAINFNWNEFEKSKNKKLMRFYSRADLSFSRISKIVFVAGLVSSVALVFISPSVLNYVILSLYALIIVLSFFGIKPRKFGRVTDEEGFPLSFGVIRAFSAKLGKEVSHSVIGKTGKYFMLVPNGNYNIKVQQKTGENTYEDVYTKDIRVSKGYVGEKIKI